MDKIKEKIDGKVVDAIPCTVCDSSNALRVYEKISSKTGVTYYDAFCFKCHHFEPNPPGYQRAEGMMPANTYDEVRATTGNRTGFGIQGGTPTTTVQQPLEEILKDFNTYPIRAIANRCLTKETCEKYGVRVSLSPHDGETILSHKYPYYRKDKLTGYKERIVEGKLIYSKGDCKSAQLFGSHCVPSNGKTLFITEGEIDCLSLYQVLKSLSGLPGWEPSVVSLSHGSSSAARDISNDYDYVNSFEKIVLVFDQDDAGQAAVDDACKILAGKVFVAKMSENDPNDMLMKGKAEALKWDVLKHARKYMPDSIVNYADCWERYKNSRNQKCYGFPDRWQKLNEKTYGVRDGELIILTSGSGMGKTQFLREIKAHFHETTDHKFADIALEEDLGDSMAGLISLRLNQRISLPDVEVDEDLEKEAFDHYFASERWAGYDHFGGMDDDNLFSKLRWYGASGHKMIFLDHLSIIVSEYAAEGGERERIDTIMTKLAKMAKELGLIIFLIVHLRKTTNGTSFEEGGLPTLDDLRGSGSLKQLSMTIISLSRNQQHPDPFCANTTLATVLKCRFTGRTGPADYFNFNDKTGRMTPIPCPAGYHPEKRNQGSRTNTYTAQF